MNAKRLANETKLATKWRLSKGRERNTPYHQNGEVFYREVQKCK